MRNKYLTNQLHREVQIKIQSLIDQEDLHLEYKFPIRRADIFWESKRIVFEVQCSPITLREVKTRTADHENLGHKVIWILHQKTFNKKYASPAELFLRREKKALYTDISQHGDGVIFDQEEAIKHSERRAKSFPLPVDVTAPSTTITGRLYFKGDLTSLSFRRFQKCPHTWKAKLQVSHELTLLYARYYWAYIKWTVNLN